MSETAIELKNSTEVQCLTKYNEDLAPSQSLEKNAMQCVKRRLQYSQLPVRCQKKPFYRPAKNSFKFPASSIPTINLLKSNPAKNSPEKLKFSPGSRIPVTPRCKRSISLVNLSPVINDPEFSDFRSESSSNSTRREEMEDRKTENISTEYGLSEELDCQVNEEKKAASLVCHVLVMNAWRKRRQEVVQLEESIQQLNQQVAHLHIQIVVLRRLLENENSRVGQITAEVNQTKLQLIEVVQEKEALILVKESLESKVESLKNSSEEKTVFAENLRNQLLSAQSQLQALDGQIARDREKLLKLREDKKMLLEKITANETLASDQLRVEKLRNEELQLLVASAKDKTQFVSKELRGKKEHTEKLEEQLKISKTVTTSLENKLSEREAALRRVEAAYNLQICELNELKERLIRQSEEHGWSNRVLQFAGNFVRAPRAIFRTLSFLSTSGTPFW